MNDPCGHTGFNFLSELERICGFITGLVICRLMGIIRVKNWDF